MVCVCQQPASALRPLIKASLNRLWMDKYTFSKVLGEGSFAVVYEAYVSGERVAIKKIKQPQMSWTACLNMRELRSLKTLGKHQNIVALKELILHRSVLLFVFEFLPGNLHDVIRAAVPTGGFPDSHVRLMASGILSGMAHMHMQGFMHRDLKPENILCDAEAKTLKIADLGLAREIRSQPPYTEYVATRWYRSPELVLGSRVYSSPVDVWACGVIIYELLTLSPLFPGASDLDMAHRMCKVLGSFSDADWKEGTQLCSQRRIKLPVVGRVTPVSALLRESRRKAPVDWYTDAEAMLQGLLAWNPRARPSCSQVLAGSAFLRGAAAGREAADAAMQPAASAVMKSCSAAKATCGSGTVAADDVSSKAGSFSGVIAPAQASQAHAPLEKPTPPLNPRGASATDPSPRCSSPNASASADSGSRCAKGSGSGGDHACSNMQITTAGRLPAAASVRPPARVRSITDQRERWGVGLKPSRWGATIDNVRLRTLFDRFDVDSSGGLDKWELALLLVDLGLLSCDAGAEQEAQAVQWLERMDADGSGTIAFDELSTWWHAPGGGKALVAAATLARKLRRRLKQSRVDRGDGTNVGDSTTHSEAVAHGQGSVGEAVRGLSAADTAALRSLFTYHDKDMSGSIDQSELLPLLVELGVLSRGAEEDEVNELLVEMELASIDQNNDGVVSFEELCEWWAASGRGPPPQRPDVATAKMMSKRLMSALDD